MLWRAGLAASAAGEAIAQVMRPSAKPAAPPSAEEPGGPELKGVGALQRIATSTATSSCCTRDAPEGLEELQLGEPVGVAGFQRSAGSYNNVWSPKRSGEARWSTGSVSELATLSGSTRLSSGKVLYID